MVSLVRGLVRWLVQGLVQGLVPAVVEQELGLAEEVPVEVELRRLEARRPLCGPSRQTSPHG